MTALAPIRLCGSLLGWSVGRFAFPIFLGFEVVVLMSRTDQWRGEWAWTIDWVGGIVVLLGPFIAALCAWQAVVTRQLIGELGDLAASWRAPLADLAGIVGWTWLAHLCGLGAGLGLTASSGASDLPNLWPVIPQFAALAGYAGLGLLLGALVPNPLIGPLTGVTLLFAVTQFSASTLPPLWVYVGGATSSLVGLHYNPEVLIAQTILGGGLAAAGILVARPWIGRLRVRWAAVPALAAVALSGGWLATDPDHYVVDRRTAPSSCHGTAPEVCVLKGSAAAAPAVQRALHQLEAFARSIGGTDVPRRFVQVVNGQSPASGRPFALNPGAVVDGRYAPDQAAHYFVYDGTCSRSGLPPARAVDALELLSKYLAVGAGLVDADQLADAGLDRLLAMSERTRTRWAVQVLSRSWSCDFNAIAAPTGGS